MTVSRESSVKEIEMSQLRQSFLTLSENAELLEHDFKKSQLEATMTNEKTKTEIQALENDISNKRALVQTQIESIENMLKHLATIPQTNAETHPHPSMYILKFGSSTVWAVRFVDPLFEFVSYIANCISLF